MSGRPAPFSAVAIGEQSLLIGCCEELLARGHRLMAVVSENRQIGEWCAARGVECLRSMEELESRPGFDYLFSITNLRIVPAPLIGRAAVMAINFHDGPLPRYAGINVPVWALLSGETEHGITWHQMAAGADTGPILVSRRFPIAPDETAFTLNALCYQEGLAGFFELLDGIEQGTLSPRPQDLSQRLYFGKWKRPAAILDWGRPAAELQRLIRALDFGPYPNPLALPKIDLGASIVLARSSEVVGPGDSAEKGTIQSFTEDSLTVACHDGALRITRITNLRGEAIDVPSLLRLAKLEAGSRLPLLQEKDQIALSSGVETIGRGEDFWLDRLQSAEPIDVPFAGPAGGSASPPWKVVPLGTDASPSAIVAALAILLGRLERKSQFSVAYVPPTLVELDPSLRRLVGTVVPLPVRIDWMEEFERLLGRVEQSLGDSATRVSFLSDLPARIPIAAGVTDPERYPVRIIPAPAVDYSSARALSGDATLTVVVSNSGEEVGFLGRADRLDAGALERIAASFQTVFRQISRSERLPVGRFDVLSAADHELLASLRDEESFTPASLCLHELFERQVEKTPDRAACIAHGRQLTYRELNESANRLARLLQNRGVKTGDLVGVMVTRSLDMLIALYAVHKAGAAYVPLDPAYPAERLGYMIEDSGLNVVVTQRSFASRLRAPQTVVLEELGDEIRGLDPSDLRLPVAPSNLAYVIYTSGSTGRPKGVMVEHGNVANFYQGMDQRIGTEPGVWLAVTSISFDISVLELFWTLARGFTVVLHAGEQGASRPAPSASRRRLEFNFFYWNVASESSDPAEDKYRLLLEGSKFADTHGFNAVWNPERHFETFGGLFPNPAVTCAALATVTRNVSLRAGSCVVPLHSPIRIAEEWAVVDNLSGGRVAISIAAGWAAPDFAIRPENFANAKQVMFESADVVRRLWRGESVNFPGPTGEVPVRTLPRPIQPELPLWVTTAGNIETFIQAGKAGMNVLTHLLGQTVEEVATKVRAYRNARAEAGHAGRGIVTLMLHTFVGPELDAVERTVREPLKNYLRSAMFLVKAAAWQFPAFRKMSEEQGKTLDQFFATISDDDLDGLLEFAFQRYFRESGLFGTPESCLAMVDRVLEADADEIACLIDFGIDTQVVLDHLPWLDRLRETAQETATIRADEDHESPAALIERHAVTHFQCTPSMARMLAADGNASPALASLHHLMVGGEEFPPDLARTLAGLVRGRVTNMYGPTETTIWSATGDVEAAEVAARVPIGRPLPGQQIHILDDNQQPVPPSLPGELVIGGCGVVRGYWKRPELTAERFLPDLSRPGGRMYRTGDLGRLLPDGRLECLGRIDQQVKIRGYRVELGEIENLLRGQDGIADAVVLLREDTPGDQRLVAYLRTDGSETDEGTLRDELRKQLPEFMVPSAWVRLDEFPLTPNGKVDRQRFPAPMSQRISARDGVPKNDAEAMVIEIWKKALGVPAIGTQVNFFDVGGHSLLAVQVLHELRERVSRPLRMTDLFKYTTVESLARFISDDVQPAGGFLDRSRKRSDARRAASERRRQK
jgi:natural product biosynthesis luciferase-like monooxygenase protein